MTSSTILNEAGNSPPQVDPKALWINEWVNNRKAGDLGRYRTRYGVIVMPWTIDFVASMYVERKQTF